MLLYWPLLGCPLTWLYLIHLPEVGAVCRRGEYKPGIYSDRGQCPVSRSNGNTVFLDFLRKDAKISSQQRLQLSIRPFLR